MVRVTFLPSNGTAGATVELVEPAGPRSPIRKFAEAGGGIHHVCYEVDDLIARIDSAQQSGCVLVRVPLPAAAFGGRKIAWVKTGSGQLVEYLQR
jgi:methylmalonyl-CoA/ethylmalonyl-CoA epimerase